MRLVFAFIITLCCACHNVDTVTFETEDLTPWCILGFDSLDRTPTQRIAMLKEMGFTKYGFNKGKGHMHEMVEEFQLAKANDIEIVSIFLWLNAKRDSVGQLGEDNRTLFENLKEVDYTPTIWVSFSENFFKDLNDEESKKVAIDMVSYVKSEADKVGCNLALYNHHGWFGNPYNQVEIIETLAEDSLTMVYNFHHGHDHVDEFPQIVKTIKPYLSYVNLNGVKKDGPKILPIGEGDHEFEMIHTLQDAGYDGPWGILGHIKTEDVQEVLQRNLDGLSTFRPRE